MIELANGLYKVNKGDKKVLVFEDNKGLLNAGDELNLKLISCEKKLSVSNAKIGKNKKAVFSINFSFSTGIYIVKINRKNGNIVFPDTYTTPLVYVKESRNLIFKNIDL